MQNTINGWLVIATSDQPVANATVEVTWANYAVAGALLLPLIITGAYCLYLRYHK